MAQKLDLSKFEDDKPSLDLSKFDSDKKDIDLSIPDYNLEEDTPKPEPKKGWLSRAWDTISSPLTDAPSRFAKSVADYIDNPQGEGGFFHGLAAGATQGAGDVLSSLTSPVNLALALASGGESLAAKAGLSEVAPLLHKGVQALSLPFAGHGAYEALRPDASLAQRGMGIAELAGGLAGLKSGPHAIASEEHPILPGPRFEEPGGMDWVNQELAKLREGKYNQDIRPPGPWEENVPVGEVPKKSGDQLLFDLAREKHNMAMDMPESEVVKSGPIKDDLFDQFQQSQSGPVKPGTPWMADENTQIGVTTDTGGSTGIDFGGKAPKSFEQMLESFGGAGHPESPEYVNKVLSYAENGKPGLSVEAGSSDIPGMGEGGIQHVVYRNAKGEPVGVARVVTDQQGKLMVQDLALDKNRGLLSGRAAKAIGDKLAELGATEPAGTISPDAINFKEKMSRGVAEEFDPSTLNFEDTLKSSLKDRMNKVVEPEITPESLPVEPKLDMEKFGAAEPTSEVADSDLSNAKSAGGRVLTDKGPVESMIDPTLVKEANKGKPTGSHKITLKKKLLTSEELDPSIEVKERPAPTARPNPSMTSEIWNASRSLQSIDLPGVTSAALRQSRPLAFSKDWFKAWNSGLKSFGSDEALKAINDNIKNSKYFKPKYEPIYNNKGVLTKYVERPSVAEKLGVRMTDVLNRREEAIASSLAEKIPGYGRYVKASNRAYTGFLNDLRMNKFQEVMDGAIAAGRNPETDLPLGKAIADFVNNATGRGSLNFAGNRISLEGRAAEVLGNSVYSPRALAARLAFMNPANYTKADPLVRQEYWKSLARIGVSWGAFSGLASLLPDAHVNLQPTNADFGKVRIGNTRIDPGAGFQQLLVLTQREMPSALGGGGTTTSTGPAGQSGKFTPFGQRFGGATRLSTAGKYAYNQLHPSLRFIADMLSASKKEPFDLTDRSLQMVLPMYATDIADAAKDDNTVAAFFAPLLSSMGTGVQTYSKGDFAKPQVTPFIKSLTGVDLPTTQIGR